MSFKTKKYNKKLRKGLKRDHIKHKAFKAQAHKHLPTATPPLPGKTNFRGTMAGPMNQQDCGCCWAFSTTNTLYSQCLLEGKKISPLAVNYLINNCGGVASEEGCNGGDFDAGLNMLNGKGPWLESDDPFTAKDGGQCKVLPVAATAYKWVVVGDGMSRPTAQQLCEAIYNNGKGRCLSVDVAADDTWSNYASGIYTKNTSQEIDHMIRIVDYDAETSVDANGNAVFNSDGSFKNGDGYFYVRNNWDTDWGENGDMRSRYGANNLAETAMFFELAPVTNGIAPTIPTKWWHPLIYIAVGIGLATALVGGLTYAISSILKLFF